MSRVRKALLMAIDRWGGSQGLSRISTLRAVGGVMRPGSPFATPEADLVKLPGFSKDINAARAEASGYWRRRRAESQPDPAQPEPRDAYTPAGVFLVDQWRQIGVTVDHKHPTPPLSGDHERRQPRSGDRLLQPVHGRDSSLGLAKYLSVDRAPAKSLALEGCGADKLYDDHLRERDPANARSQARIVHEQVGEVDRHFVVAGVHVAR